MIKTTLIYYDLSGQTCRWDWKYQNVICFQKHFSFKIIHLANKNSLIKLINLFIKSENQSKGIEIKQLSMKKRKKLKSKY